MEFTLSNLGRVPFDFSIGTELLSSVGLIEASPMSGSVQPEEKTKIILRFRPGVPVHYKENILVNVAHFDPAKLVCYAQGIFPVATVSFNIYHSYISYIYGS